MTRASELRQKADALRGVLGRDALNRTGEPILADYDRIAEELGHGGIWSGDGLDLRLRSFATITACCLNRHAPALEEAVRDGLSIGISPQEIKGAFIELMFYAGVPATVSGLRVAHGVIGEREEWQAGDVAADVAWIDPLDDMLEQGRRLSAEAWGDGAGADLESSLARQMVPEAARMVDAYHYGQVWARPDLGARERMVCILSALTCRRHITQLGHHVGYALDAGLDRQEILQVLVQAAWYRGWPVLDDTLMAAREAFERRGRA